MPPNPNYSINVTVRDRSGEAARYTINQPDFMDISTGAGATAMSDWITIFGTVCDGVTVSANSVQGFKYSNAAAATVGQREERWLCTYSDTVDLTLYQVELPCRKASVQPPVGTDDVDLTVSPWTGFKTGFESIFASPTGHPVTLEKVTLVGRNS